MSASDTIAAIATPNGRGGVGIIRVSGPDTTAIASALLGNKIPSLRQAAHRQFRSESGEILDDGIAVFFQAPNSFTGEDVLELQGHGGTVVLDRVLQSCLAAGARLAKPGEFSERAFLNDKLDLTQAEAIADLIDSRSEQAARSAIRGLQGEFSAAIDELLKQMINLRMYVEAALDFPEEEIDFLADQQVTDKLHAIQSSLADIQKKAHQGSLLRDGMQVVIVGKPNAGKSSLLNALSGNETAIVTEYAGTTRDVLRETINLDGMPLHIVDTAGLRNSDDPVEKIGIARAQEAMQQADLILYLSDDSEEISPASQEQAAPTPQLSGIALPEQIRKISVRNKIDLSGQQAGSHNDCWYISAKTGSGIEQLKAALKQHMGFHADEEGVFIARRRHLRALEHTDEAVQRAAEQLQVFNAGELMAEELRIAQEHLGEITGRFTSDDLLGSIFSSFCIGK